LNRKKIINLCIIILFSFYLYIVIINAESPQKGWSASWYEAGGKSKAFFTQDKNIPVSEEEDIPLDPVPANSLVIFKNSEPGKKDSLKLHFIQESGKDLKGEWSWVSAGVAMNDSWSSVDVSSYNTLVIFIKGGDLGNKKIALQLGSKKGNIEKSTKEFYINSYLKKKRITQDWQKAKIPFSYIKGIQDIDLKNLAKISFNVRCDGEHIVYIDNILFTKQ